SGTLVFDEVDTGIGGDVGNAVGRQLKRLARDTQIICVTHLPQIAVRGDRHILVEKQTADENTVVQMRVLNGEERVREIARMLSGNENDPRALAHAAGLLSESR
nr:DNA repair protein RecN [bacterium]